jgi:hypothetical protein
MLRWFKPIERFWLTLSEKCSKFWHHQGSRKTIAVVLVTILVLIACSGAMSIYQEYTGVRSEVIDGILHLEHISTLLQPLAHHPTIPDSTLLKSIQTELTEAKQDFTSARRSLSSGVFPIASHISNFRSDIASAMVLLNAADDACLGGLNLVHSVQILAPILATNPLNQTAFASSTTLDTDSLNTVTRLFRSAIGYFTQAAQEAQHADLSYLPSNVVSAKQRANLQEILAHWPTIHDQLAMADSWLKAAPSLLGVNQPEHLLVELMDKGELRPTGGFIGSYGVMTIQKGRIHEFTLDDIFALDTPYVIKAGWPQAPSRYSWWPFSGFALRDSNLSADFPTSAKLGIDLLRKEGGPQVQGVIALTIPVIENILGIMGSIPLPNYHVTVTAHNLESLIRQYTETSDQKVGSDLPTNDQLTTLHERFTALLGRTLMSKLKSAKLDQLISIGQSLLSSLHTKDLQIYLSNSEAEKILTQQGVDASITRGSQDGVTIVDANTAGNKANLFTSTTYNDAVSIDSSGKAIHHLTITYIFKKSEVPGMIHYLYGRDYYQTYLRVYTPTNASLQTFGGFNGGDEQINKSDELNRQMWGGYVHVQDNIAYSLHFIWSVQNVVIKNSAGQIHYALVFQHQAGSNQNLNLSVTLVGTPKPIFTYAGKLDHDHIFGIILAVH